MIFLLLCQMRIHNISVVPAVEISKTVLPRTAVCSWIACCLLSLRGSSEKQVGSQTEDRVIQSRCSSHLPDPSQLSDSSGCSNPSSPIQPAITFVPLPASLLLPVEKAALCQSLILAAEEINFMLLRSHPPALVMLCSQRCSEM